MTNSFTATVRTRDNRLETIEFESISPSPSDAKAQCESMTGGEVVNIHPTSLY
jgi:hypothetical protein